MTEENKNYIQEIEDLLAHYVDGRDIFKIAPDWTYPATKKPSAPQGLPDSWLALADKVISIIAQKKYGLDIYPNVIEIVDTDQMRDAYTKIGMPVSYDHWSFGKNRALLDEAYEKGRSGLAYEMIINSNPAYAHCMEQNSKTMQLLVIAHASYGHNSFFKGNHLFQQFTEPAEIISDLTHLKNYIKQCEEKYGFKEVEKLLDACHALEPHGVDRYKKPPRRSPEEEAARRARIEEIRLRSYDEVMDRTMDKKTPSEAFREANDNVQPDKEENLLRYIAANAPHLKDWQRDIMVMISDKAQYFYPQGQTKIMNEGWASFWHYTTMKDLYELNLIDDGMMMEFLDSHTGVLYQPDHDHPHFKRSGMNPYALSFAVFQDIKRICLEPTAEDREWFPDLAGKPDWLGEIKYAMSNFKDESFVLQYLSPKVMRDFHLFAIQDDAAEDEMEVVAIHDERGYRKVREVLASQYRLSDEQPRIEVEKYEYKGDRSLTLHHTMHNRKPLDEHDTAEVMKYIFQLWQHPVILNSVDEDGDVVNTVICRPPSKAEPGPRRRQP